MVMGSVFSGTTIAGTGAPALVSSTSTVAMCLLSAPFKPKDTALFAIISGFDAAYSAYNGFQSAIERYWALKYLDQEGITELDAAVMKDGLVRADTLPLVFRALGAEALPRNARVRVRLTGCDLLTLDLHASVSSRIDDPTTEADDAPEIEDPADEAGDSAGPLRCSCRWPCMGCCCRFASSIPNASTGSSKTRRWK